MANMLDNWNAAGLICGGAFSDEMQKLAFLKHVDDCVAQGMTKEALHPMLAGAAKILKSPIARRVGGAALLAGAGGAGGAIAGRKVERSKAEEEMQQIAPQVFRAGFVQGARAGFMQGAQAGYREAKGERA